MTFERGTAFVSAIALLAAWLAAWSPDAAQKARPASTSVTGRSAFDPLVADVQTQGERLRARLNAAPMPTAAARNPFEFHERPRPAAQSYAPAPSSLPAGLPDPAVAATPAPPPFSLVGVAEHRTPEGPVRTAVIAGSNQLFLVKAGEQVTLRYRVASISADAVELTDLSTGGVRRLGLK